MWVVESATSVGSPYVTVVGNGAFPENTVPPLVLTVDPDFHGTPRLNWEGTADGARILGNFAKLVKGL